MSQPLCLAFSLAYYLILIFDAFREPVLHVLINLPNFFKSIPGLYADIAYFYSAFAFPIQLAVISLLILINIPMIFGFIKIYKLLRCVHEQAQGWRLLI